MTYETFTDEELDQANEISDLIVEVIPDGTNCAVAVTGCLIVAATITAKYARRPHLTVAEDNVVATFRKLCDVARKTTEKKKGK